MAITVPMMRLLIIIVTVLIWANVEAFTTQTRTITAPIEITNLPTGLAIAEPLPEVRANLSGRAIDLSKINKNNLRFAFNLNGVTAGQTIETEVMVASTPARISVISYEPHILTLSIDRATTKTVSVTVDARGFVADGYAVTSITTDPAQVTVTGHPKLLEQITEVVADVAVLRRRATFTVPAIPRVLTGNSLSGTNLIINPQAVLATINVAKGNPNRHLGVQPTFTGDLPAGFFLREVRFNPPLVTVTGNGRLLENLNFLPSTPISLADRSASFTDSVSITLPTGVSIVGENLLQAEVIIERSQASREFSITPDFVNVTEGFSVTVIIPRAVNLVVVGQQEVLANLKRSDIKLNIDLQRILTGSNQIPITAGMFNLPVGVGVGSFTPESIEVILSRS